MQHPPHKTQQHLPQPPPQSDTDRLVEQAASGDVRAGEQLLERHRPRLRQMVAARMDPRLAARVDPSDIVQDALVDAHQKLPAYLRDQPLPFYPWLRSLAWNRLVDLHRKHVLAQQRAVDREQSHNFALSDESMLAIADRLREGTSSPSERMLREELEHRVREAMQQMRPNDREILVMRHLEDLSVAEVAAILNVAEGTVKSRHYRALQRLRRLLSEELGE